MAERPQTNPGTTPERDRGRGWGRPVVPSSGALRPLGIGEVRLTGGFWADRQGVNGEATLGHCHAWMTRLGWVGNFRAAAAHRQGREFADSEVYKLLEGLSWEAARPGGQQVEPMIAELSAAAAAAQEPDGYLNTRFGGQGRGLRYSDLEWGHELYCYGHLIQAAVARLRTHGDDRLTAAARRAADHVCREFGADGRNGVCGHPEIEPALVELFRATGEDRYLEQARLFVDRRGRGLLGRIERGQDYFQDDIPVGRARVLRGHAVRALYLACGAVDVAVETGDTGLLDAVAEQWRNTVAARTYLTGGMGSRHVGESFGDDLELPPDGAYSETCAGVAAVMLSWRLLLATGEARYADLTERVLYNVVAGGPAADGRAFFYANPLQQRVPDPVSADTVNPAPTGGTRSPWFHVACCPTNVARTLASLAGYVATTDDRGVQLHQLTGCTVRASLPDGRAVALRVTTGYPWSGAVTVRVEASGGGAWRLSLRVPAWAEGAVLVVGATSGQPVRRPVRPGYAVAERPWQAGDEIRLELPVTPRWTRPDPRVDAVRGTVAVERGPLVYCAESIDQDTRVRLEEIRVDPSTAPTEHRPPSLPEGTVALSATGQTRSREEETAWPYGEEPEEEVTTPTRVGLIPFYVRANRGPAAMRVWLPEQKGER